MVKKLLTMFTLVVTMLFMLGSVPVAAGYTDEGVLMPFEVAQNVLLGSAYNLNKEISVSAAALVNNADGIRPAGLTGQTGFTSDKVTSDIRQLVRGGAIVTWAKSPH